MTDAEWKAQIRGITDPVEMLRAMVKDAWMFYGDSYYGDLISTLVDQAEKTVATHSMAHKCLDRAPDTAEALAVKDAEHWWRAEDKRYANYDPWAEFDQPPGSNLVIELRCYPVVRHTPRGVWLDLGFGDERFVRGTDAKQFAVPTRELAMLDLIARKKRHVQGAQARLRRAEEHLAAAEHALALEMARKCPDRAPNTANSDLQRPVPTKEPPQNA